VPDPSTFTDAQEILIKYLPKTAIPATVSAHIERGCRGEKPETLKPGDKDASRASHTLIASNQVSAQAALAAAQREGFNAEIITCELTGEARLAGEWLVDFLMEKQNAKKPYVGIAGGETTVKVTGQGLGGRNLEVALGAVCKMSGMKDALLITLATDGEDGPTDAAGSFVTGETLSKALNLGLEPETFLANNDAYHFFEKTGGLILIGPSGTNVNDLNFVFWL
jgi:glycerate 2-kinase